MYVHPCARVCVRARAPGTARPCRMSLIRQTLRTGPLLTGQEMEKWTAKLADDEDPRRRKDQLGNRNIDRSNGRSETGSINFRSRARECCCSQLSPRGSSSSELEPLVARGALFIEFHARTSTDNFAKELRRGFRRRVERDNLPARLTLDI